MFRSNIKFFILIAILTLPVAVLAAWRDAPAGPPNYGSFSPDTQADYKPMNLGPASQVKQGGIGINLFSGNTPGANIAVNQTATDTKVGSSGDAIYVYANSVNAAISAEQAGSGYAVYSSGGINYFGGNVGIGTTTPAYKLAVAGQIRSSSGGFVFPDGTTQSTAASSGGGNVVGSGTLGYDSYLPKWISSSGNALGYSDIYNSDGNVGIGTASPGAKLDIVGNGTVPNLRVTGSSWGDINNAMVIFDAGAGGDGKVLRIKNYGARNDMTMFDVVNNVGTVFAIRGDGNVGIGTTNPGEKLQVSGGNILLDNNVFIKWKNSAGAAQTILSVDGSNSTVIRPASSGGYVAFQNYANNINNVTIADSGLVTLAQNLVVSGTGNTTIAGNLEVAGQVKITGGSPGAGKVLTSDVSGLATWQTSSVYNAGTNLSLSGNTFSVVSNPTFSGNLTVNGDVNFGPGYTTVNRMVANGDVSFNGPTGMTVANNASIAGNLIMGNNIELNGNWLSNDGGNEGINIDNSGNVGIGMAAGGFNLKIGGNMLLTGSVFLGDTNTDAVTVMGQFDVGSTATFNGAFTVNNPYVNINGFLLLYNYFPGNSILYSAPTERLISGSGCVTSNRVKVFRPVGPGRWRLQFDLRSGGSNDYIWTTILCNGVACSPEVYRGFSTTYQTNTQDMTSFISAFDELELQIFAAETSFKTCSGSQAVYVRNVNLMTGGYSLTPLAPGVAVD